VTSRRSPAAALAAYVLHRWDWSESSLIVDLFTRERGRVVVAAKGAKRPTSQLRPVLLPFQRLLVQLGRTPADDGEVHLLRSAEWAGTACAAGAAWASGPVDVVDVVGAAGADDPAPPAPMVPLSGAALFRGFHLNELLLALLARQDPHPVLFDAYAHTLPALQADDAAGSAALRAFELLLLRETGVLPELSAVTLTHAALPDTGVYLLHPEAGVVESGAAPARDLAIRGRTLRALEAALAARDLAALRQACAADAAGLRQQLRGLLQYHVGARGLRTRQVMLELQRLMPAAAAERGPR
jgi:DNA repair protein RecO (recombination protein O)